MSRKNGISILLPCYKSEDLLYEFFYAFDSFSNVPIQIVYYDNGGNGNYRLEMLKEICDHNKNMSYKEVSNVWLGNGENIGLNKALNECAKHAYYDYFYLCHTDMCLLPGWDQALLKEAKRHAPGTYLFCSRSIEPRISHTPFQIHENFGESLESFQRQKVMQFNSVYTDKSIVTAYRMPFFFHRKLWDKMGGVDSWYFSYSTDDDLFLTAYDVGVRKFWMINESLVYHLSGQSNAKQNVDRNSTVAYQYLITKWKNKGYRFDLPYLDQNLQNLIPWNMKIK